MTASLAWMGGAVERAFHRGRTPELPWGTLRAWVDEQRIDPVLLDRARLAWTDGAWVEHGTAVQLAAIVHGLLLQGAPVDLVGLAGRFVAEEMAHVELHARVLHELGGAVPYEPPAPEAAPLDTPLRLAAAVVRTCCVGESVSVPVLAATRRVATHPLVRGVYDRLVEDEGPHAQLGWWFLEGITLTDDDRASLGRVAAHEVGLLRRLAEQAATMPQDTDASDGVPLAVVHGLGWLDAATYARTMTQALDGVVQRLARHGIPAG